MEKSVLILDSWDIQQKVKRLGYEILENTIDEGSIVLIGIRDGGYWLAEKLVHFLKETSDLQVDLFPIRIDKEDPSKEEIDLEFRADDVAGKTVILVDDVVNTGRTLAYSLKPLLNFSPARIQVAVLVDRKHKQFPISADYVGLGLATTMKEHIRLDFQSEQPGAYLV